MGSFVSVSIHLYDETLINDVTVLKCLTWIGVIDESGSPFDCRQKCGRLHGRAEVVLLDEVGGREELHLLQVLRM